MPSDDERIDTNRTLWTAVNAQYTDADARRRWASDEIVWGLFNLPESKLRVLGDLSGMDVLDLACGSGYFSAWLVKVGARPIAVDLTPAQLQTASQCQQEFGITFPLIEANAEEVPLPDDSFDLVVSEHGAGVWCDPDKWLPEAARMLRPGGRLVFLVNSLLSAMCVPADGGVAGDRLLRGQREMNPATWPGGGVEHHLSHGDWIRSLRRYGFTVDALHELYPPDDATTPEFYDIVTAEWARQWPAEELWVAHLLKAGRAGTRLPCPGTTGSSGCV